MGNVFLKVLEKFLNFLFKNVYEPCFQLQGSNFVLSCLNPFPKGMLLFSCLQKVINSVKMTNYNKIPRSLLNVISPEKMFSIVGQNNNNNNISFICMTIIM